MCAPAPSPFHFALSPVMAAIAASMVLGAEASPVPEVNLEALDFVSNVHNLYRDGARLSSHGDKYPVIEWQRGSDAVAPIMHAADKPVQAEIVLQLRGVRPGSKLVVTGESDAFLTLDLKGEITLSGFDSLAMVSAV